MRSAVILAGLACFVALAEVHADEPNSQQIQLGATPYRLQAPENWKRVQPRTGIVDYEFSVAPVEGAKDPTPGRVTIMGAGGGIEQNIQRWKDQFRSDDGGEVEAKVEESKIGESEVYLVDISGTYLDKPGPFVPGPGTPRDNYRMFAAIIRAKVDGEFAGDYFIKFYGPEETVTPNMDGLRKMVQGLATK